MSGHIDRRELEVAAVGDRIQLTVVTPARPPLPGWEVGTRKVHAAVLLDHTAARALRDALTGWLDGGP